MLRFLAVLLLVALYSIAQVEAQMPWFSQQPDWQQQAAYQQQYQAWWNQYWANYYNSGYYQQQQQQPNGWYGGQHTSRPFFLNFVTYRPVYRPLLVQRPSVAFNRPNQLPPLPQQPRAPFGDSRPLPPPQERRELPPAPSTTQPPPPSRSSQVQVAAAAVSNELPDDNAVNAGFGENSVLRSIPFQ
ncbi:hypothetical protein M3Y99_00148800 [Aphelenchoides fujianensis]|nr:hypothetical protein M3Y99_00148800 [Aphelenchoides fujianensis]